MTLGAIVMIAGTAPLATAIAWRSINHDLILLSSDPILAKRPHPTRPAPKGRSYPDEWCVSSNLKMIAYGSDHVAVGEVQTGKLITTINPPHHSYIGVLTFSPTGNLLAFAHKAFADEKESISVYDIRNRKIVWTVAADNHWRPQLLYSPDAQILVAPVLESAQVSGNVTHYNRLKAWDVTSGDQLWESRLHFVPSDSAVSFTGDSDRLVAVMRGDRGGDEYLDAARPEPDPTCVIYDARSGRELQKFPTPTIPDHRVGPPSVALSPDGTRLAMEVDPKRWTVFGSI